MINTFRGIILLMAVTLSQPLWAENIDIPVGQQPSANASLPVRGQSQSQVLSSYGEPEHKTTIGQPPISRWIYSRFSVYFESDQVIHTVSHFKPSHPLSP